MKLPKLSRRTIVWLCLIVIIAIIYYKITLFLLFIAIPITFVLKGWLIFLHKMNESITEKFWTTLLWLIGFILIAYFNLDKVEAQWKTVLYIAIIVSIGGFFTIKLWHTYVAKSTHDLSDLYKHSKFFAVILIVSFMIGIVLLGAFDIYFATIEMIELASKFISFI